MPTSTMHCGLCPDVLPGVKTGPHIVDHMRLWHPDHYDPLDRHPYCVAEPETEPLETTPNTPR